MRLYLASHKSANEAVFFLRATRAGFAFYRLGSSYTRASDDARLKYKMLRFGYVTVIGQAVFLKDNRHQWEITAKKWFYRARLIVDGC